MEARISKERGDRDIALIKELNLGNCKSSNVVGLSEEWKNLEKLNLSNIGLESLKGFPRLPSLKTLQLGQNNLSEGFDALAVLPKLEELDLSENKIKELKVLQHLTQITTLKKMKVTGCDVCKVENYKEKLFNLIPSLSQVDGIGKKQVEHTNGVNGNVSNKDEDGDDDANGSIGEEEDDDDDSLGDEDEEEDDDVDEDEEDIPLEALYGKIQDEGDDDDFEANEEEEEEDIDEEDDDDEDCDSSLNASKDDTEGADQMRGTKRKLEEN